MISNHHILLTIDVEDWFQVENFKPWIPFETWDQRELRVERNVHRLLNLFDSVEFKAHSSQLTAGKNKETLYELSAKGYKLKTNKQQTTDYKHTKKVRTTFFVLGWLSQKLPNLVREIHSRGHEVASHGVNHQRCDQLSFEELKRDLSDSKKHLEDILGGPVTGYRAPSFSINEHVIRATEDAGYLYGSSYNSFNMHERYGQIDLSANGKKGIAHKISDNFFELPLSNLKLLGQNLPWSGGAYFRIIPYGLFKKGVQSILKSEGAYVFYMHPWEIDPLQPRVEKAYFNRKFRHYSNLSHTYPKLRRLIESFQQHQFVTCSDYIHRVTRTNNDHQQTINKAQPSTNYRLLATD